MTYTKTLRPYQEEGLRRLLAADKGFILFWGMRSGKTLTACKYVKDSKAHKVVIVGPPRVQDVWHTHINECGINDVCIFVSSAKIKDFNQQYAQREFDVLIIDELHQYNSYSQRFRALRKLRERSKFVIGLTGTPFDKDTEELFYPMQFFFKYVGNKQTNV